MLTIRAIPSITSKMHYNDRYLFPYTKKKILGDGIVLDMIDSIYE